MMGNSSIKAGTSFSPIIIPFNDWWHIFKLPMSSPASSHSFKRSITAPIFSNAAKNPVRVGLDKTRVKTITE